MILYFDNYITDQPLYKWSYSDWKELREGCDAYRMPDKLSIAMYTLASYAVLPWSHVIIKYSIDDPLQGEKFERFVKELFPKAIIMRGRSDTQQKFRESFELLKKMGDEWIFYAGNVDHPFMASETATLHSCMAKAKELAKNHKFVSVLYSHFPEQYSSLDPDSFSYRPHMKLVEKTEKLRVVAASGGLFDAIQIVNMRLFEHWFCSKDLGDKRVIRSDLLGHDINVDEQMVVLPNKEICVHFDGYALHDLAPMLFMPKGFFEREIRIAYGYNDYRDGWVNMNPTKQRYSFRDRKNGTDLKLIPEELPLFWKGRIKELDVNPEFDLAKGRAAYAKILEQKKNAWPKKPFYNYLAFKARTLVFQSRRNLNLLSYCIECPEYLEGKLDEGIGVRKAAKKAFYKMLVGMHRAGLLKKKAE